MKAEGVVDRLARLVAWPTVSDRPLVDMAAWLAERAEARGMVVERFDSAPGKCNIVARAGPEEPDGLVLSGHMDVVPVEGQDWSSDPFRLTERDGRLHARGACDMKGFIAATEAAMDQIDLRRLRRPVVLIWTHDEEVGCQGSAALVKLLQHRKVPLPKHAIIGEPTSFRACRLHPGHTTIQVQIRGRAAHSSRPDLGLNAIELMGAAIERMTTLAATLRQERDFEDLLPTPWPVLNLGRIRGGTAINIVADQAELQLGIRQLPGQQGMEMVERVREALEPVARSAGRQGGALTVRMISSVPALLTPLDAPILADVLPHACEAHAGAVPFATDGGNLSKLGVDCVIFGPGSIEVAHRADEFVPLDELHRAVEVIGELIQTRCA